MGSYPTYEEWKQRPYEEPFEKVWCSYPTYEEWKPFNSNRFQFSFE